jgi:kynurenine formamidase
MKLLFSIANDKYFMDTEYAHSIAIPLKFNGKQPNHFGAPMATQTPMKSGDFIGDTKQGGSCNADNITLNAHCNGTHTESIHHIVDESINIGRNLSNTLSSCLLLSVTPRLAKNTKDSYKPHLEDNDKVIDLAMLKQSLDLKTLLQVEALAIRTLPNSRDKSSCIYDENNHAPFFTRQAMNWLSKTQLTHLLVDFPSVDRMNDDGLLSNHHKYWKVKAGEHKFNADSKIERTITEMIFVKDTIEDGLYCLNLQVPAFELDAAPSRPILYPIEKITKSTNQTK